jgi:glutathione synthase/RimK-type ligase-like ATP-grasp enzyme
MRKLLILIDNDSMFLISIADLKNYTSMEINKIKNYFLAYDFDIEVIKYCQLDFNQNYKGVYIIYQSSETINLYYRRYIEDVILFLEKQGAIVCPKYEYLKAHHNKIYMEMLRSGFVDNSLKTIKSKYFGSWLEAYTYQPQFPIVIKQTSGAGSAGVFLAKNRNEYEKYVRIAGALVMSQSYIHLLIDYFKNHIKKLIKYFYPSKEKYLKYIIAPISKSMIVQTFIAGLNGDYKVLIFGRKYYTLFRRNRDNDFRASGSGKLFEVSEKEHEGLLNFARKITFEIDFPIIGLDIGFDGKDYHLFEFQMIHVGPYTLQSSNFWHEYNGGKWVRYEGASNLEEEFSRTIYDYIHATFSKL